MSSATGFDRNAFRGRLSQTLNASGRSARQIAKDAGVSRSTLIAWAAGERAPHLDRLEELAAALGVDSAWLLFGASNATTATPAEQELERLRQSLRELAVEVETLAAGGD